MKEKDQIAELFRMSLEHHEEQVRPEIWSRISSQLTSPQGTGKHSDISGVSKSALTASKVVVWVTASLVTGSVLTALYFNLKSHPKNVAGVLETPVIDANTDKAISTSDKAEINDPELEDGSNKIIENPTTSPAQLSSSDFNENKIAAAGLNEKTTAKSVDDRKSVSTITSPGSVVSKPSPESGTQSAGNQAENGLEETKEIKILASQTSGSAPLKVTFSVSGQLDQPTWNFADSNGMPEIGNTLSHVFTRPGIYNVICSGTDKNKNPLTRSLIIKVMEDLSVRNLPNIFTPNGDGSNDEFDPGLLSIHQVETSIFDKSGKPIWSGNSQTGGWDGRLKSGDNASEGTYFYVIFVTDASGRTEQQRGTVTLKR